MKKLISAAEAAGMVKDGMTVMIGGFLGNGSPHAIIDALVESGVKDLTLIVNDTAYPDKGCGRLIAGKQVRKVIVSHIGTNPCTSEQMNSGELEIEFCPQGTLAERVRSGRSGRCAHSGRTRNDRSRRQTNHQRRWQGLPARKTAAGRRSPARREPGRPIGQPGL